MNEDEFYDKLDVPWLKPAFELGDLVIPDRNHPLYYSTYRYNDIEDNNSDPDPIERFEAGILKPSIVVGVTDHTGLMTILSDDGIRLANPISFMLVQRLG